MEGERSGALMALRGALQLRTGERARSSGVGGEKLRAKARGSRRGGKQTSASPGRTASTQTRKEAQGLG